MILVDCKRLLLAQMCRLFLMSDARPFWALHMRLRGYMYLHTCAGSRHAFPGARFCQGHALSCITLHLADVPQMQASANDSQIERCQDTVRCRCCMAMHMQGCENVLAQFWCPGDMPSSEICLLPGTCFCAPNPLRL